MVKQVRRRDWGKLRVGRLVKAKEGRKVFEDITRRRIDPALLEQDAPNTFSGRVFPIRAKGYNRVILAYEQTLPEFQRQRLLRFAFPRERAKHISFRVRYNTRLSELTHFNLSRRRCRFRPKKGTLLCAWEKRMPAKTAVVRFQSLSKGMDWVAGQDPLSLKKYLYAQLRLNLPKVQLANTAPQAIFLLDTSLSSKADNFRVYVSLLQRILQSNGIRRFNVLTFDTQAHWLHWGWWKNTAENRSQLGKRLKQLLLEGATDLQHALRTLAAPRWLKGKSGPVDVFVLSDGGANWGERQKERLLSAFKKRSRWKRTRFFAYQLGLGSENLPLMKHLTREGGAVFACRGRSELERCAKAHTRNSLWLKKIRIEGVGAKDVLVASRQTTFFPGSLLTFAARIGRGGKASVVVEGEFLGKPWRKTFLIPVRVRGELAARAWGELAVAQLISLRKASLTSLIVAHSQHFRIPNEHVSYLVLETDKEYKQYGLEREKTRARVGDLKRFLEQEMAKRGTLPGPLVRWHTLLKRLKVPWTKRRTILSMLSRVPKQHLVFSSLSSSRLWTHKDVSHRYLQRLKVSTGEFDSYIQEANRRWKNKRLSGAVRALSNIVELNPRDSRGSQSRSLQSPCPETNRWQRQDCCFRSYNAVPMSLTRFVTLRGS